MVRIKIGEIEAANSKWLLEDEKVKIAAEPCRKTKKIIDLEFPDKI